MSETDYFNGFDENKYKDEARQRWGYTPQYKESQRDWQSYSRDQKEAIKAEGGRITIRMVGKDARTKPDDPDVQAAVADYHAYINIYFYACDTEFMRKLSDIWVEDLRFAINYERIREGGATFMCKAVNIFCNQRKNKLCLTTCQSDQVACGKGNITVLFDTGNS